MLQTHPYTWMSWLLHLSLQMMLPLYKCNQCCYWTESMSCIISCISSHLLLYFCCLLCTLPALEKSTWAAIEFSVVITKTWVWLRLMPKTASPPPRCLTIWLSNYMCISKLCVIESSINGGGCYSFQGCVTIIGSVLYFIYLFFSSVYWSTITTQ